LAISILTRKQTTDSGIAAVFIINRYLDVRLLATSGNPLGDAPVVDQ